MNHSPPTLRPRTLRVHPAVPTSLTVLRLAMAVTFPFISEGWRAPVALAGGLSDWIDGWIARRFHATSFIGGILDAIADKLFVFIVIVTLMADDLLAPWQAAIVLVRDITVGLVALYVLRQRQWLAFRRMRPRALGKITTFAQFALIIVILLIPQATLPTLIVVALFSLLAAVDYLTQFIAALRQRK